jgi:UDP-N-acetylglucosamine diphosphorylase / glucose-1-phosphate thymidylyltransferase / UDP-N-acetylgalactosamine diphosphorylase / glucosamine-1-phosphate N-acetyltransferase / galactosamine-1-phosphate N-acetyltransferase
MRLCLVEDDGAADLEPLTLTRPSFDLFLGSSTLGDKIARAFGIGSGPYRRGVMIRPHLAAIQKARDPHTAVNDRDWLARGPVLVANGRWVPPAGFEPPRRRGVWLGLCQGQPACALVGSKQAVALEPNSIGVWFDELAIKLRGQELGGEWVQRPWDIVAKNAEHLVRDFQAEGKVGLSNRQLTTAALVGPANRLYIHETARIDPYTVFDTTNGPITVAAGAVVQPFTRIEGPSYIGRDTHLFRANLRGGVTLGPLCRIGGEVEQSIVHGYVNKYHEGFLGHAYVGEWVNLGAITSNSDLRNDYGEVYVPLDGDPVPTGQTKVGCFIGDHTRTGMGSMLNTGTAIGVMCNVLPAGPLLPKHVPSFSAVLNGWVVPGLSLDQLFDTARIVMSRRGQAFSKVVDDLYRYIYHCTRIVREQTFQKAHDRRAERRPRSVARLRYVR